MAYRPCHHLYDVCIIHSGSENEIKLEDFIQSKLRHLGLTYGPMTHFGNRDYAILNDNLKTIKHSKKAVLIFSPSVREKKRCRFERLYALHLHVNSPSHTPDFIPLVFGQIDIPEKYSVFEPLLVHETEDWCLKLLLALATENTKTVTDTFANQDRDSVEKLAFIASVDSFIEDDFNEFETDFDTSCFYFLDDLIRTVPNDDSSLEYNEVMDLLKMLCEKLESCSISTRKEFLRTNSKCGLFPFIGQMGLNNLHKLLMEGCGMSLRNDVISLTWKTFKHNLVCSTITLADIVNFSKFLDIRRISIKFDKESHDNMEDNYGQDWTQLFVIFGENILKHRLCNSDCDMLTYHINFNGKLSDSVKQFANHAGRSMYHDRTLQHQTFFKALHNRLRTYESAPQMCSSHLNYARAGFVYSGFEDTKTCFICNQTLFGHHGNKELDFDDILFNHCFWQPNCKFLMSLPNYNELQKNVKFAIQILKNNDIPIDGTVLKDDILNKRFASFDKSLPKQRCLDLARAGFSQKTNEKNNLAVKCFSCATEINYMKLSQDFWFEHARWSPECKYLIEKKGERFVRDVKKVLINEGEDDVYSEVIIETYVMKRPTEQETKNDILQMVDDTNIINDKTEVEIELD